MGKIKNKFYILFILIWLIFINFLHSEDIGETIKEGIIYLNLGDYGKCIKILEEAKENSPQNSDIYYYLGEAYFRKGDIQNASINLKKAIEINPQNQAYYYTLAYIYLAQNKNNEAIELLDKIIKISPLSFYGKQAKELKETLETTNKNIELIKKWGKIEGEEKEKKTLQSPEKGEIQKEEKIPVDKLIKRIKFGTVDTRKTSSDLLLNYSSIEISKVIKDIIEIIKKEKIKKIRKNLILASGKVNSPEVIDLLLEIMKNDKELFEIKLVALDLLEKIKTEKIVSELRNIFAEMVDRIKQEKEEAKGNLEQITQQLNDLKKRIEEEKTKKGAEEIRIMEEEINELERRKTKYEILTSLQEKKIDISYIGSTQLTLQETATLGEMHGVSSITQTQIKPSQTEIDETKTEDEAKNEVIFMVRLMNFLASIKDKESLEPIKKGWNEFGVPGLSIYYYIALGKLGEYTNIDELVSRLKRNYPQENLNEEINIRKSIVEVLGEYIKNTPNEEIKGLIEYLAEECEYIQIKNTAKQILAKIGA